MRRIAKKGAIELSVGTIVVVVLAMSMLILGLVLVRNIFRGAIYNVDTINDKVKGELNKLFTDEGRKVVIFLPNNEAKIKKDETFGVAFAIQNTARGKSGEGKFTYVVKASSIEQGCQLNLQQADTFVTLKKEGSFSLAPGDTHYDVVKIRPSESSPLCEISYDIEVKKDGQAYDTSFFIIDVSS